MALRNEDFKPASKKSIIIRMLRNLFNVAERNLDTMAMMEYLDTILTIDENAMIDRWRRAKLLYQEGKSKKSIEDLDWILRFEPAGMDLESIRKLRDFLLRR